jgi:putative endonuclease
MRNIAFPVDVCAGGAADMLSWFKRLLLRGARPGSAADERGAEGERLAAEFLRRRHGFEIVARNWRNPRDAREELDLVCRDGEVLVFVEVKSRPDTALVPGYHAVDRRKKRVLRRAIHAYLTRLRPPPRTFRFDVVEVVTSARMAPQTLHYENVPLFSKGHHVRR